MNLVPFSLMLQHTRIGLAELRLVESLTKLLRGLSHLLIDLLLDLTQVILDQHIRTITFLRVAVINQGIVEGIHMA